MSADQFSPASDASLGSREQLANSTGPLLTELAPKLLSVVTTNNEGRATMAGEGLARLRAHQLLTDDEVSRLTSLLHSVQRARSPQEQAQQGKEAVQHLRSANANPIALAVASVVAEIDRTAVSLKISSGSIEPADIGDVSTVGGCACAGAIVGATAGLFIGGPAGVIGGAAAGAIGGAIGFGVSQYLQ